MDLGKRNERGDEEGEEDGARNVEGVDAKRDEPTDKREDLQDGDDHERDVPGARGGPDFGAADGVEDSEGGEEDAAIKADDETRGARRWRRGRRGDHDGSAAMRQARPMRRAGTPVKSRVRRMGARRRCGRGRGGRVGSRAFARERF